MSDEAIFLLVVGARFGIPLLIPRFPFPAILASLVIDAADQTIFQNTTDLDLDGYQGYDKALDIYYLSIAYLSTIRNWFDPFAFRVSQFLWYYRLVGVTLFELTEVRALLIIFPNTFEYFFIFYEGVRLWWNPRRLNHRQVLAAAAAIWIFIKLPQEWWIHIAMLDFTDFMKEDVLGVNADTPWGEALSQNWWFVALLVGLTVLAALAIGALSRRLPPPDWSFNMDVDAHREPVSLKGHAVVDRILGWPLLEKVVLASLITIIFAQVLPESDLKPLEITVAVGLLVVGSAGVSHVLATRGASWSHTATEFAVMLGLNTLVVVVLRWLLVGDDQRLNEAAALFFVVLLTLIITLFDRYHRRRELMQEQAVAHG